MSYTTIVVHMESRAIGQDTDTFDQDIDGIIPTLREAWSTSAWDGRQHMGL